MTMTQLIPDEQNQKQFCPTFFLIREAVSLKYVTIQKKRRSQFPFHVNFKVWLHFISAKFHEQNPVIWMGIGTMKNFGWWTSGGKEICLSKFCIWFKFGKTQIRSANQ